MKRIWAIFVVLLGCAATPALAYDAMFTGRVTMIEPTYMPAKVVFASDVGSGSCSAGAMLTWIAQGDTSADKIANTQAVLALLQTAKATGGSVDFYINLTGCSVVYIHFL